MNKQLEIKNLQRNCKMIESSNKTVVLSDLHLGVGDSRDNALKNALMIFEALKNYYNNDYNVVLLGDTFELAENNNISEIECVHENIMWVLGELHKKGLLTIVRGNHDACLTSKMLETRPYSYTKKPTEFLPGCEVFDAVKLSCGDKTYFMAHGHQVIFRYKYFNSIINFGIRHFWSPLERWALKEPTSETAGFEDHSEVDAPFEQYAQDNNCICICGHTHSVVIKDNLYYNCGGGVMPRSVTCVEITESGIDSYKWAMANTPEKGLIIQRSKIS